MNKTKIVMKGNTINLRQITENDLQILKNWRNASGVYEFNTQFTLLNMKDQKNWFKQLSSVGSDRLMFIVTDKKNRPIGVCGLVHLNKPDHHADVAIILGEQRLRGKGRGSEMLRLVVEYGFEKLGLHRIGAEIFDYNIISMKLFEKLGFVHEVTLRETLWRNGKWWDIHVFSLLNDQRKY